MHEASRPPPDRIMTLDRNRSANAGANLRELMERMGHSSTRAALIYLHSTGDRQRALADALGELAQAELAKDKATRSRRKHSGMEVARRRDKAS